MDARTFDFGLLYLGCFLYYALGVLGIEIHEPVFDPNDHVVANPRFRSYRPLKIEGFVNERIRLGCGAKGSPKPYIHWYRKKNGLISIEDLKPRISASKYTLTIKKLKPEDEGLWTCRVWNQHGQLERNFTIKVLDCLRYEIIKLKRRCKEAHPFHPNCREGLLALLNSDCEQPSFKASIRTALQNLSSGEQNDSVIMDEALIDKWVADLGPVKDNRIDMESEDYSSREDYVDARNSTAKPEKSNLRQLLNNMVGDDPNLGKKISAQPAEMAGQDNPQSSSLNILDAYLSPRSSDPPSKGLSDWNAIVDMAPGNDPRPPKFSRHPKERRRVVAVPAGHTIRLPCRATGNPEPTLGWFKNNVEIQNGQRRGLSNRYIIRKWVLEIPEAVQSDVGEYKCQAENDHGHISHTFTVKVVERFASRPIMNPHYPRNQSVTIGSNVTFLCDVLSDLQPHITWYRHYTINGSYEDETGTPHAYVLGNGVDDTYAIDSKTLVVINVTYDHEGWYSCVSGNAIGVSHRSAFLTVEPMNDTFVDIVPIERDNSSSLLYVPLFLIGVLSVLVCFLLYRRYRKQKGKGSQLFNQADIHPVFQPLKKKVIIRRDSTSTEGSLIPTVHIATMNRSGLLSDMVGMSEYELPLDPKWEISRDTIQLLSLLGEGAHGKVYRGTWEKGAARATSAVAVKMLKEDASDLEMKDLVSEMELMKSLSRHTNIINLLGCCTQSGPLYVVVELCENGNLRDFLRSHRIPDSAGDSRTSSNYSGSGYEEPRHLQKLRLSQTRSGLTQRDLVSFAFQIARGMDYLESKHFVHRDLAARNVLVTRDCTMKIADFGMSRDVHYTDYYRRKNKLKKLPVKWMAPESLYEGLFTSKGDVWAYGIVLWEIWTMGGTPYPTVQPTQLLEFLTEGYRNERPHNCVEPMWEIMLSSWNYEPSCRPSFHEVVDLLDAILSEASSECYTEAIDAESISSVENEEERGQGQGFSCKGNHEAHRKVSKCSASEITLESPVQVEPLGMSSLNYTSVMDSSRGITTLSPIPEFRPLLDLKSTGMTDEKNVGSEPPSSKKSVEGLEFAAVHPPLRRISGSGPRPPLRDNDLNGNKPLLEHEPEASRPSSEVFAIDVSTDDTFSCEIENLLKSKLAEELKEKRRCRIEPFSSTSSASAFLSSDKSSVGSRPSGSPSEDSNSSPVSGTHSYYQCGDEERMSCEAVNSLEGHCCDSPAASSHPWTAALARSTGLAEDQLQIDSGMESGASPNTSLAAVLNTQEDDVSSQVPLPLLRNNKGVLSNVNNSQAQHQSFRPQHNLPVAKSMSADEAMKLSYSAKSNLAEQEPFFNAESSTSCFMPVDGSEKSLCKSLRTNRDKENILSEALMESQRLLMESKALSEEESKTHLSTLPKDRDSPALYDKLCLNSRESFV